MFRPPFRPLLAAATFAAMLLSGCKDSNAPTTSSAVLISDGVAVTGISASKNHRRYYRIVVPANATELKVETDEGSGDVDLTVRYNRLPTILEFECSSFADGNEDGCEVANPAAGDWYIMLHASEAYSGVRLMVTVTP